ncbi:MAG: hypothetical protein Q8S84_08710 [bacterium]|nr:hypothetical protein [bacterium]
MKSIASSSTINAGSLVIFSSFFSSSSRVVSTCMKSDNHSSSRVEFTLFSNTSVFSGVQ